MRKIVVLGSTGSIGTQTLDVIRNNDDIKVIGLSAYNNIRLLEQQIREFQPQLAVVGDEELARELRVRTADLAVHISSGMKGLLELAQMEESEMLVTAVVGMIGIRPTIAAIKAGKDIALANKETLVTAGHLIMPLAEAYGVRILPVDSEHSALFQVLQGEEKKGIRKLLITASGGPFRGKDRSFLEHVKVQDALKHPNWAMGKKITVDSATLVNKGLEVMEARWLFGVELDQIEVVIQPTSVIHSMVEFVDGSVIAQMGPTDMRLPIQYALYYPERKERNGERLDFRKLREITFDVPDTDTFQGLPLAIEASRIGGSMLTVFNAANERAVAAFLEEKIGFLDIYTLIEEAMSAHRMIDMPQLEEILAVEQETCQRVDRWIETNNRFSQAAGHAVCQITD